MPKYSQYTQESLEEALLDVSNGSTVREAARTWGVPRSTLQNRLKGYEPHSTAHSDSQRLSIEQEKKLVKWIKHQELLGLAPTHSQIRFFATKVLSLNGDTEPLGRRWMQAFLRRNPELRTRKKKPIEMERFRTKAAEIKEFYQRFSAPEIRNIPAHRIYNIDEGGLMEGLGVNGLVVGRAKGPPIPSKNPGRGTWMTFVECCAANGHLLPPLVIFRGVTLQSSYFPTEALTEFDGWKFTTSENGYTSNDHHLNWLKEIFIPETRSTDKSPQLLLLDGHTSHVTDEFMWECFQNSISVMYFPSHCTHILQPLDVGCFSPLKAAYRLHAARLYQLSDASPFGKCGLLLCLQKAREIALTAKNIKAGFRGAGIFPLNAQKGLSHRELVLPIEERPKTPQNTASLSQQDPPLKTPHRGQDVLAIYEQAIGQPQSPLSRLMLRKIKKGFDEALSDLAEAKTAQEALETQLEAAKPKKRAVVKVNPNTKFASIEAVIAAKKKAKEAEEKAAKKAQKAKEKQKLWEEDHPVERNTATYIFEDMCFTWQAE